MFGNGQIFVSHTHQDNERCQPILAALDAWQSNYWFDLQELDAGQRFSDRIQEALGQRDIFLRIGTEAAERSFWMDRELRAVRGMRTAIPDQPRLIVQLMLSGDAEKARRSAEAGEVVIDTTRNPRAQWLHELHQAIGADTGRRVSRRTAILAGAATVVAAATTGVAAKIFLTPAQTVANLPHPNMAARPLSIEPGGLPVRWQYSLGFSTPVEQSSIDYLLGLAGDDTAVYALAPSSQEVLALSLRDGKALWAFPDPGGVPRKVLTGHTIATSVDSSSLFILSEVDTPGGASFGGGSTFNLMSVDKASGKLHWKSENLLPQGISLATDLWSELCLANTDIYFQLDGKLYGYSQDGAPLWTPLTMFTIGSNTDTTSVTNTTTPAFDSGAIFVGTVDGRLLAVEAATGALSWSVNLGTAPVQSSPAAAGGLVYIGATDGHLYAFNAATGSLAWKTQVINLSDYNKNFITGYTALIGAATANNGTVYIQASVVNFNYASTWLYALDAKTGKLLWKVDPTTLSMGLPPLLASNALATPSMAPWYPAGNIVYTTVGIIANTSDSQPALTAAQALLALNRQDGSLHAYRWVPVDGEHLQSSSPAYYPSGPVPVPAGIAFMTNEPQVYVVDV